MCEMMRYLFGAVVVLVTICAALLAIKLRAPDNIHITYDEPYSAPTAETLLTSPRPMLTSSTSDLYLSHMELTELVASRPEP